MLSPTRPVLSPLLLPASPLTASEAATEVAVRAAVSVAAREVAREVEMAAAVAGFPSSTAHFQAAIEDKLRASPVLRGQALRPQQLPSPFTRAPPVLGIPPVLGVATVRSIYTAPIGNYLRPSRSQPVLQAAPLHPPRRDGLRASTPTITSQMKLNIDRCQRRTGARAKFLKPYSGGDAEQVFWSAVDRSIAWSANK